MSKRQITIDFPSEVKITDEELAKLLEKFSIRLIDETSREVVLEVKWKQAPSNIKR